MYLKILQWNCRSISTNLYELIQHLSTHRYQVLALQSLNVIEQKLPKFQNYYYPPIYQTNDETGRVSTALYIQEKVDYIEMQSPISKNVKNISISAAKLTFNKSDTLNIMSVYLPKGPDDKNTEWIRNLNDDNDKWLIAGDFNSHAAFWDNDCKTVTHNRFV